jgi:hypothetical protein
MSSNAVDALSVDTAHSLGLEPPAGSPEGKRNFPSEWIARCVIISTGGALAWYTWGHWGDFQIDNGREIYVPSAILHGKLLYRDLWYMYGPLAPYVKALLFWIFGVHLTVLYLFGLALTLGTALVTFEVARQFKLGLPASVVPSLFFLVEAFYPFIRNFVFPYSYAASVAAFLGLVCLHFVIQHISSMKPLHMGLAAVFAGLVILTKQEFGFACLALLGFNVVAAYWNRRSRAELLRNTVLCLAGLTPALVVYGWFVSKVSVKGLLFQNWISTPGSYFMRTFGKRTMADQGFRLVPAELLEVAEYAVLAMAIWYVLAALNAALFEKLRGKSRLWMVLLLAATMLPLLLTCLVFFERAPWGIIVNIHVLARSLWESAAKRLLYTSLGEVIFPSGIFLLVLFYLLHAIWKFRRTPNRAFALQEVVLGLYAVLVGFRQMMELEPNLYKCAVFFNVPAFLVFVILVNRVIHWASRSLEIRDRNFLAAGMCSAELICLFVLFFPKPQILPGRLTTDYGSFYTSYDVAALFPQIISFMKTHTENGRDILVLPEPPSLYVFAGLQAPTRWYSLMPGYVAPEQEPQYIEDLKLNHVKYVLIGKHDVSEYGVRRFEEGGYNQGVYSWIMANYVRVGQIGPVAEKTTSSAFYFVSIYKRKGGD